MAEIKHCYRHPKRETRVSCASCERPICTDCMVQTDVGIKCPDDARLPRGARAGVMKPRQIALTLLAGLGVAIIGIPVVYLIFNIPFQWLISAAAGYGAGTLINRAGGRNGGPLAIAVSVVAAAIPFLLVSYFFVGTIGAFSVIPMLFAAVAAGLANRQS